MAAKNKFPKISITTLGGNNEKKIGKNCHIIEIETKEKTYRFMLDLGVDFPPYDSGYSAIFPDITDYFDKQDKNGNIIEAAKKPLDAIFITHGHLDHIGAIAEVANMGYAMPPIYASEFNSHKIKRLFYKMGLENPKIRPFNSGMSIKFDNIEFEIGEIPHSALESSFIHLLVDGKTPEEAIGILFYGDFHGAQNPVGKTKNMSAHDNILARKPTQFALLDITSIDDSNSQRISFEETVCNTIEVITQNKGKTVISPVISGSIENIATDVEAARRLGKKIFLDGKAVKDEYRDMLKAGYKDFKDVIYEGSLQGYLQETPASQQYFVCSGAFAQGMEEYEKNQGHDNNIWLSSAVKMALGLSDTHQVSQKSLFLLRQREIPEITGVYWPKMVNKLLAQNATVVCSETQSLKGKVQIKKMQNSGHINTAYFADIYNDSITYITTHGNDEQRINSSKRIARMSKSGKSCHHYGNMQTITLSLDKGVEIGKKQNEFNIAVKKENHGSINEPNITSSYIMINEKNEKLYELCQISDADKKAAKKEKEQKNFKKPTFADALITRKKQKGRR